MSRRFLPERRLVLPNPKTAAALEKGVPGVKDYTLSLGEPVACICRHVACRAPLSAPEELLAGLKQIAPGGTTAPAAETPGPKPHE
jgi:hypothetical protein